MKKSTEREIKAAERLVENTRERIKGLMEDGKKVHVIWDFDGVLSDSRSDDVFAVSGYDLETYFEHEERLLFETPDRGPWLLGLAHTGPRYPNFPRDSFTQDIVTARSSTPSMRVQQFCLSWNLKIRWMLFLGHQPKLESYRIILDSLKPDPDYHVFCVDDKKKHIDTFEQACEDAGMQDRTHGVVSPVIREYTEEQLKAYLDAVMGAAAEDGPIRVRDRSDDYKGYLVLPGGLSQYRLYMKELRGRLYSEGVDTDLRQDFIRVFGEVGEGRFKTEEELQEAMYEFIIGLHIP